MELNFNPLIEKGQSLKNSFMNEFTKELSEYLKNSSSNKNQKDYFRRDDIQMTRETEEKLKETTENIIRNHISNDSPLYYVLGKKGNTYNILEYSQSDKPYDYFNIKESELPYGTKEGEVFRKENNHYIIDSNITNEIMDNKNNLLKEQEESLNNCRVDGIYTVTGYEDDCETWQTFLTNKDTGITFQEIDMPHEIYHQIAYGSELERKNGQYRVIPGTSSKDLYPNEKNFCEVEGKDLNSNKNNNIIGNSIKRIIKDMITILINNIKNALK